MILAKLTLPFAGGSTEVEVEFAWSFGSLSGEDGGGERKEEEDTDVAEDEGVMPLGEEEDEDEDEHVEHEEDCGDDFGFFMVLGNKGTNFLFWVDVTGLLMLLVLLFNWQDDILCGILYNIGVFYRSCVDMNKVVGGVEGSVFLPFVLRICIGENRGIVLICRTTEIGSRRKEWGANLRTEKKRCNGGGGWCV